MFMESTALDGEALLSIFCRIGNVRWSEVGLLTCSKLSAARELGSRIGGGEVSN